MLPLQVGEEDEADVVEDIIFFFLSFVSWTYSFAPGEER